MAAINIQSLFADIIDTPEQRQMKMLQEGMLRGDRLASGLTGLTRAAAPLAQVAGQLGVQRQENLRRAVQPMLGIDPRTTGEKMAEQLQNLDPENPDSLLQAAQSLQSIDPVRAAALRQAAAQKRIEKEDRERAIVTENLRQTQIGTSIVATQQDMRLQLAEAELAQQKAKAFFDEHKLTLEKLRLGNLNATEEREARADLLEGKKNYEDAIIESLGDSDAEKLLKEGIRSRNFSMAQLQSINSVDTDYTTTDAQYVENGKPVNYIVAIDKNNPRAEPIIIKRSTDQPKGQELGNVPALTVEGGKRLEGIIDGSPVLKELTSTDGFLLSSKDPVISKPALVTAMHRLMSQYDLDGQQAGVIIANTPVEDVKLGRWRVDKINEVRSQPSGVQGQTQAMNEVLTNPEFAGFSIPAQESQPVSQPMQPLPAQIPEEFNPFGIGIRPQQESFQVAPTARGIDAQFEARIKDAEEGMREGRYSPSRLQVIKNQYVNTLNKDLERLNNEFRYLSGLPERKGFNKQERIDSVKAQIKQKKETLDRYSDQ